MNKLIRLALGVFVLNAATALAAEIKERPFAVQDEITREECGECHVIYPPSRLPMGGWKKMMANLKNHFGDDASLSASTTKHIKDYLTSNSMDSGGFSAAQMAIDQWARAGIINPMRITETTQWIRQHNSNSYKLMSEDVGYTRGSNCINCHKQSERGRYETFPGRYGIPKD